jgi:hypothetical protein
MDALERNRDLATGHCMQELGKDACENGSSGNDNII